MRSRMLTALAEDGTRDWRFDRGRRRHRRAGRRNERCADWRGGGRRGWYGVRSPQAASPAPRLTIDLQDQTHPCFRALPSSMPNVL